MQDLKYITKCKHRITSEELNIRPYTNQYGVVVEGVYVAELAFNIVPIKGQTFIRSYNAEQEYFQSNNISYTDYLNYSYKTLPNSISYKNIPEAGLITTIGITNYTFEGKKTIIFGSQQNPSEINISSDIVPANRYFIDYYVDPETCPLCGGSGFVQDIGYNDFGEIEKAEGHEKLSQRVLKTLLTKIGSSPEDLNYGSSLNTFIGSNINIALTISMQKVIYEAVQYLIQLQSGLSLTAEETCTGVYTIDVDTEKQADGLVVLTIVVLDGNGAKVDCSVTLRI